MTGPRRLARLIVMPLVAAALGAPSFAAQPSQCQTYAKPEGMVLLGYSGPGEQTLRAFARLSNGALQPDDGSAYAAGQPMRSLLSGEEAAIETIAPYVSRSGTDHCVYRATLSGPNRAGWTLWASEPLVDAGFRPPDGAETARFRSYRGECRLQGDPPGAPPPCVYPELVAISDLNGDGRIEFWHTVVYTWDTGLRVAEERHGDLVPWVTACSGCSD